MAKLLDCSLSSLEVAVNFLKLGGLVSFPTETVYGLGANAYLDSAVSKIYEFKNRPPVNPLIVHYKSIEDALCLNVECNDIALNLAKKFWPGPMTLVLKKKIDSKISSIATAGLGTLAVRVPDNKVCQSLLQMLDFPLVAPSANKSTTLSTTTAQAVIDNFVDHDDLFVIDGGECNVGIESTIIDVSSGKYASVLRYGIITPEEIEKICPLSVSKNKSNKPIAPGMMFRHYAPKHEMMINSNTCSEADTYLDFSGNHKYLKNVAVKYLDLSEEGDLKQAASNLFKMLRILDDSDCSKIVVSPIENTGIGIAINDKLKRAAGLVG